MNDTRKEPRLQVSLVTHYREPSMIEPREGQCRDISPGGMFIMTPRPSPRGALIRFECATDVENGDFCGTGRVVWQRNKSDPRGPAGMGVRFVRLEAGGRDAVARVVEQARLERARNQSDLERGTSSRPPPRARSTKTISQPFAAPVPPGSGAPPPSTSPRPLRRSPTLRGVTIHPPPVTVSSGGRSSSSAPPPARPTITFPPGPSTGPAASSSRPPVGSSSAPPASPPGGDQDRDPTRPLSPERQPAPAVTPTAAVSVGAVTKLEGPAEPKHDSTRPLGRAASTRVDASGATSRRSSSDRPSRAEDELTAAPLRNRFEATASSGGRALLLGDGDNRRSNSRWVLWTIVGAGVLASFVLIRLYGSAPVGIPELKHDEPRAPAPPTAPSAPTAASPEPTRPPVNQIAPVSRTQAVASPVTNMAAQSAQPRTPSQPPPVIPAPASAVNTVSTTRAATRPPKPATAEGGNKSSMSSSKAKPQTPAAQSAPSSPPAPSAPQSTEAQPPAPEPSPKAASEAPQAGAGQQTPLQLALQCLGEGNNDCVIRTLAGKATSAREFEVLIATYRAMGAVPKADAEMEHYLKAFPSGARAREYKRLLDRRNAEPAQPGAQGTPEAAAEPGQ